MKSFDADISAELAKEVLQEFYLLEVTLASSYMRFTDCDISIYHGGNLYSPRGMAIDNIVSGSSITAETVTVSLDDADQVMSAYLLNEDVRNKVASIYFGVIARPTEASGGVDLILTEDEYTLITESEDKLVQESSSITEVTIHIQELWRGFVSGWEMSGDSACSLRLTHEFVLWNKSPLRKQMSSCRWSFGSTECGYSGATGSWCDQSHDRCLALGNQTNFGGFRFIPDIAEKEIWWGRTAKI